MNNLAIEKTMTIKEISNFLNIDYYHVYRKVKKLFPEKFINGQTTYLNEIEVSQLSNFIKTTIKNKPLQNAKPTEKVNYITKDDLKDFAKELMTEMMKSFLPLIQNNQITTNEVKKSVDITKPLRAQIVENIRQLANKMNKNFSEAWNKFYKEIYYCLSINLNERSKNIGCDKLDYIDIHLSDELKQKCLQISYELLKKYI